MREFFCVVGNALLFIFKIIGFFAEKEKVASGEELKIRCGCDKNDISIKLGVISMPCPHCGAMYEGRLDPDGRLIAVKKSFEEV